MHPSFCIGFQVHHPLSFVEHDPNDPKEQAVFERMATEAYVPFVEWYQKRLLDYPQLKGFLSLSGAFFDYCSNFPTVGDDLIDNFRRIVSTERVEVVAEPYNYSLEYLDDVSVFLEQIQRHHDVVHDFFGTRSRYIRLFKQKNYSSTALLSQYIGFNGLVMDASHTHCEEIDQRVLTPQEWEIIKAKAPLNENGEPVVSSGVSTRLGMSRDIKKRFYAALDKGVDGSVFADELLESGYPYVQESFVIDIEEVFIRKGGPLFLDTFLTRLLDRGALLSSLPEWKELYSLEKRVEHPFYSLGIETEEKVFQHPLQKTAWEEFLTLVEAVQEADEDQLISMVSTVEWFGRDEHFHAMISDVSPYESTYEAFESYIQGVRTVKKDLQK